MSYLTKKFNGDTYHKANTYKLKTQADKSANNLRKMGFKARVIKCSEGYDVYSIKK